VRMDLAEDRICECCGRRYAPTYPTQRWCSPECRQDFRNAELQAARKLYARVGRPKLEIVEQQFGDGLARTGPPPQDRTQSEPSRPPLAGRPRVLGMI
jgi:hypothetical protein